MNFDRSAIEAEIDRLIALLDRLDGDPDLEEDDAEFQGDEEADLTWNSGIAPNWYLIAETKRREGRRRRP